MTNVTASSSHLLVTADTPGFSLAKSDQIPRTFELRVTNWSYGVQISAVHLASDSALTKIEDFSKRIEIIGDSLSSGMYDTYEGLSSWAWGVGAGFGNVEFSVTAYPGICLVDQNCWGNPRGQAHQWFKTSDVSYRAQQIWGEEPEDWDFAAHPAADMVIINIGTNVGFRWRE